MDQKKKGGCFFFLLHIYPEPWYKMNGKLEKSIFFLKIKVFLIVQVILRTKTIEVEKIQRKKKKKKTQISVFDKSSLLHF